MNELVDALRYCISDKYVEKGCLICPICVLRQGEMKCDSKDDAVKYAADAIERLTAEIDHKDKVIQALLTQLEGKQ